MKTDPPQLRSFTRFVLPFSWRRIAQALSHADAPQYRRAQDAGKETPSPDCWLTPYTPPIWKHEYFLHEVQEGLYERAHWFVLSQKDNVFPETAPFAVCPPGLILFEAEGECPDTLRHGLLVLQIEEHPGKPCRLEDWLEWNEKLRLFQEPWSEIGEQLRSLLQILFQKESPPDGPQSTIDRWLRFLEYPVCDDTGCFRLWQKEYGRTLPHEIFPYSDSRAFVWSGLLHDDDSVTSLAQLCSGEPAVYSSEDGGRTWTLGQKA